MFHHLRFSESARTDLVQIRVNSVRLFGREQADIYQRLLVQAFHDIDEDPARLGCQDRPDLGEGFKSYRVDLSRNRSGTRVKRSHHVVLLVALSDGQWGVSRILHDAMIPALHILADHHHSEDAFLRNEEE